MSDDEADPELLELLRQHLLGNASMVDPDADTGVLESAEYVNDNAIDVALDMRSCKNAAEAIYSQMQRKHYSLATWGEHELHPTARDESTVDFIFTMDLLNFSFWSDDEAGPSGSGGGGGTTTTAVTRASSAPSPKEKPPYRGAGFAVEYRGKTWTGYYSMVAALRRALDEGIPITSPAFWRSPKCDMALMRRVFRPAGSADVEPWKDDAVEERDGDAGASGGAADSGDAAEATGEASQPGAVAVPVAVEPVGERGVSNGDPTSEGGAMENVSTHAELGDATGIVNGAGDAHDDDQPKSHSEDSAGKDSSGDDAGGKEATSSTTDREEEPSGSSTDGSTNKPPETPAAAHASTAKTDDAPTGTSHALVTARSAGAPAAAAATTAPASPAPTLPEMPLLAERLACLQEAGQVLEERFGGRAANVLDAAGGSAAKLVNILAREFSCFRDECPFPDTSSKPGGGSGSSHDDDDDGGYGFASGAGGRSRRRRRTVRFLKRAQILAAELWACFQGAGYGAFRDIGALTMFADYRVPQILQALGCLYYSPPLLAAIQAKQLLPHGGSWEVQLRGCSIWCVELIRREIKNKHPDAEVNAVLIDFFLYDTMKEMEAAGKDAFPHHRTRSIWY